LCPNEYPRPRATRRQKVAKADKLVGLVLTETLWAALDHVPASPVALAPLRGRGAGPGAEAALARTRRRFHEIWARTQHSR